MINIIPAETWACKSTETKPVDNVPDKQTIVEIDTGNVFCFDKEDKYWYPI